MHPVVYVARDCGFGGCDWDCGGGGGGGGGSWRDGIVMEDVAARIECFLPSSLLSSLSSSLSLPHR